MTYAATEVGLGREADICTMLNMPPPVSDSNYTAHVKQLYNASERATTEQNGRGGIRILENVRRTMMGPFQGWGKQQQKLYGIDPLKNINRGTGGW